LLDFPKEIKADGTPVSGFIFFKDPDGDVVRAEFLVVQATDFQPFSLDLKVKGAKEGVIEFQISTKTPQRVVLRAVLVDEAGNRSAPWEFAFEAVGPAILRVSPTSLSFSSEVGRNPASQTVQITNAGSGTLSWSASADQPWIGLSPTSGTAPSTVTVSVTAIGMAAGSYSGQITISAPGAQGSPVTVFVILSLTPVQPAILQVSPSYLSFRGEEGGRDPDPQVITIRNAGSSTMNWTATADSFWLRVSPDRGSLAGGLSTEVRVSVSLTGLAAGTYTGRVTVTAPGAQGSPVSASVALELNPRPTPTFPLLRTLQGHAGWVTSVSFNSDGQLLASGSNDSTIKLWDVATGREIRTLHFPSVWSVAFSPDGHLLASASFNNAIGIWDVASGNEVLRILSAHAAQIYSVAFSPDGKLLASGSHDKTIKLWNVATGSLIRTLFGHSDTIYSVAFSPDGRLLASLSWDTLIKLWDVATGREIRTLAGYSEGGYSVAFSPDGRLLASTSCRYRQPSRPCEQGEIKLWDVATGREVRLLQGHTSWVESVAFSPDGKVLASGSMDMTIKLWEIGKGSLLGTLQGHTETVYEVDFSPDGRLLVSGSADRTIKLWDVSDLTGR